MARPSPADLSVGALANDLVPGQLLRFGRIDVRVPNIIARNVEAVA